MGKAKRETPKQAFENLRQAFDALKSNHSDPWVWHEYLNEEEENSDDEGDDPELHLLKPMARARMERLKAHLLTCVTELNRCSQIADSCYFHMCCSPDMIKPCCIILGTSGEIDEDMLASGDLSPEKIMAMLQARLDEANEKITSLQAEVSELKGKLSDKMAESKERWHRWQESAMLAEDAITKLDSMTRSHKALGREKVQLEEAYRDLHLRHIRASRLMIYKGRQMLRDNIFKVGKKESLFYAFQGFTYTLKTEKEERIRREHEAERDRVEFALRNEVKFLVDDRLKHRGAVQRLVFEVSRLKNDRRSMACRLMHKNRRPYEELEYCLWVWELWQPVRPALALEKALEAEQAARDACIQQLVQTSRQLPPLAQRIDELQEALLDEQVAHDISRKELTEQGSQLFSTFIERLRVHRYQELGVLARMHELDVEEKVERIKVLEREIAEDKHVHALKGMVVELESNLRKALDRRKQRAFVVPPQSGLGSCPHCARENMYRNWKEIPSEVPSPVAGDALQTPGSMNALTSKVGSQSLVSLHLEPLDKAGAQIAALAGKKTASYSPVWR